MSSIPHIIIIIATWKEEREKEKINIHIDGDSIIQTPQVFSSLLLFLTARHSLAEDGALLFS